MPPRCDHATVGENKAAHTPATKAIQDKYYELNRAATRAAASARACDVPVTPATTEALRLDVGHGADSD